MPRYRRLLTTTAALSVLIASQTTFAAGGGGGGVGNSGGSMPSGSAARYDPVAEYQKGIAALSTSQWAEARRAFEHVQQVAPSDANSAFYAGVASDGMGKPKDAKRYYERAIRIDKSRIDARRGLALALIKLDMKDKAQAELDSLKTLGTQCGTSCAESVEITSAIKDITDALTGVQVGLSNPAQADGSAGDILYAQAVSLINKQHYAAALASLHNAGRSFGPHPDILTYLGYTHRKMGQLDKAEVYYRQALAIAPNHLGALEYYGELKVERGNMVGARAHLARLEQLCSFGCYESDELKRWISHGGEPTS